MIVRNWLLVTFSALALGGFGVSAQAAKQQCVSEECACEQALERNTVEALEDFLRKFPQAASDGTSACAALGVPPPDDSGGAQSSDDVPAGSGDVSNGG